MNLDRFLAPYKPPQTNLVDMLRYWAGEKPGEVAFYYTNDAEDEVSITYEELDRQARAVAAILQQQSILGQRVLLLFPPGLDFVVAFFGCLFAGATAVPAYPPRRNRKADRIGEICANAQAAAVLTCESVLERREESVQGAPALAQLKWIAVGQVDVAAADDWQAPDLDKVELAILQYTSGSTGTPKGVMLTHRNFIENCALITHAFEHDRTARGFSWLPTYHDMGLVGGILNPLSIGCPSVLMSPMGFLQKPVRWLRGIMKYRSTISGGPNFAYALCADKITDEDCAGLDLSTWRVAFNGAEPIREETLARFTERFAPYGFRPESHYPCYGMAETTLLVTGGVMPERPVVRTYNRQSLEEHRPLAAPGGAADGRALVSSGRMRPNHRLVVVDEETGQPLPDGQIGEIWINGPSVGGGYWNREDETERIFRAKLTQYPGVNFLRTGDLGFIDDGEVFITGRCKDLIVIRGRNLYPSDVEQTVEGCHDALQVGGGAVFSDDDGDEERLIVAQELKREARNADTDEIIECIRQAILEEHDVAASTIYLLRSGKLPKTSSGKVQRSACKSEVREGTLKPLAKWTAADGQPTSSPAGHVQPTDTNSRTVADVQNWLSEQIAGRLNVASDAIDPQDPFARFGLDSPAMIGIAGDLEDWLGSSVSPTLLYSYPTIETLAQHLGEGDSAQQPASVAKGRRETSAEPVAIVGLGCRFPGAADVDAFWQLLREGRDAIGHVPADRWDADAWFDEDVEAPGKMYTRAGGFLDQVDQFDPQFFNIAPREAVGIDPQQRLLLEVCWETLEHAGQSAAALAGTETGVFVGIGSGDYGQLQQRLGQVAAVDSYTGTGTLNSIAAGRLAFVLGVHGPCLSIDTACSSSLAAVHLAVQSLRRGECRAALAGGVHLMLDPVPTVTLCKLNALSREGRCRTFDESADGYVRGEGCGILLLKRLSDAVDDGDRIWAVIRGSAVNHDGRTNGLTAPHGPSQEALLQAALADAAVAPGDVGYLEAHGTGTPLGDPIEVNAAAAVLAAERTSPLLLGSVKANIGHLEAAAGIAGLIKSVLALSHGEIPGQLHFETPNALVRWDKLPLTVPTNTAPWPASARRRIAGVSSFGFSGTNAHVVLEEAPAVEPAATQSDRPLHLLTLSARTPDALRELALRYEQRLADPSDALADICYTANTGRAHLRHRLAIVAADAQEARERLADFAADRRAAGVTSGEVDERAAPKLAMLFPGQGAQFADMGRGLYEAHPVFRRTIDQCDEIANDQLGVSLRSKLYAEQGAASSLDSTADTQLALFAVEYATYQLWRSWGIEPTLVVGHSLGEYAAACVAGVFSLENGLRLVATRGRLMQALPAGGMMTAVTADERTVTEAIKSSGGEVAIAAVNGPKQVVVSGHTSAVEPLVKQFAAQSIKTQPLKVSHAFHSPLMEPMLAEFEVACRTVSFSSPSMMIVSNVHGRVVSQEMAAADYWLDQIRRPVRFADCVREIDRLGADAYLEVGPQTTLVALARQCLTGSETDTLWLPSLRRGREDWTTMLEGLAQLYAAGVEVDWRGFEDEFPRRKVTLPTYPFQRRRYWFDESPDSASQTSPAPSRPTQSTAAAKNRFDDWFYEVQWHPRSRPSQSLPRRAADYIPPVSELAEKVAPEASRVEKLVGLPRYQTLEVELDQLTVAYVQQALASLGYSPTDSNRSFDEVAQELGVAPQHGRFLHCLLAMARSPARQSGTNGHAGQNGSPQAHDLPSRVARLQQEFPECVAELTLVQRCGSYLAEVLSGQADPLQVLFPGGSMEMLQRLYRDSPFARSLNALVEEAIVQSLEQRPSRRPVRILEIGGGTGGTTARLLPRLPVAQTEYLFTDVSEIFTRAAQSKFRSYSFLHTAVLDIEDDPAAQGFAPAQFDIVLAANVLHATRDLAQTLANVRQLMAPGGLLVLLEGTRRQRWLDLIFGMTEGWWRYTDTDRRPDHPLLSSASWCQVLRDTGFSDAVSLPASTSGADVPQSVITARTAIAPHADRAAATRLATGGDGTSSSSGSGTWLIFADQQGVGDALARKLGERGGKCVLVAAGPSFAQIDEHRYTLRPVQTDDLSKVLERCVASDEHPLRGVVHLWSLDAPLSDDLTSDTLEEAQRAGCGTLAHAVRLLVDTPGAAGAKFWIATRGAQAAGEEPAVPGLAQSPLWGMGRVLGEEYPSLWGGLVDLDPDMDPALAASLLSDELTDTSREEDQLAYRRDQRFAARLTRREAATKHQSLRCRIDATYVVTGGLGGLGLEVARWLADQGARRLVLLARTPLLPRANWDEIPASEQQVRARVDVIRELESAGVVVHAAAVDIADEAALDVCFRELEQLGWPPVRGVVHCAGVAEPAGLGELSPEQLERMLRAKVSGTWNLQQLFGDERLDFFVSFSSGASLIGSPMLGGYAAANAFLDAFAHYRAQRRVPALSINWGWWQDVGMIARTQTETGRGFAPQGMQSFSPEQGIRGMQQLIEEGAVQTAVMPTDWSAWCAAHPRASQAPFFAALAGSETAAPAGERASAGPRIDRAAVLAALPEGRNELLSDYLSEQLAEALRLPREEIDVRTPLNDLGIDSLMAIGVRNQVQEDLQIVLPIERLMQAPTIAELAEMVAAQVGPGGDTGDEIPTASTMTSAPIQRAKPNEPADLENLSESEVDAMLSQLLKDNEGTA